MNKFTILMFSMSSFWEWQSGIRNRNFFILRELINRPEVKRVIMVNYLPWNFKRAIKEFINSKFKIQNSKLQFKIKNSEDNSNLTIEQFNNFSSIIYHDLTSQLSQINEKLFVYFTIDSFFSKYRFIQKLTHLLSSKFQVPSSKLIIWSYYPLFINYYDQIPAHLKIFDAVDDWRAHPIYVKQKDLLDNNYQKIKKQADIIFTVSRYLKKTLFKSQENVYIISNGADVQILSSKFQVPSSKFKFKIDSKQQSIIGYVGNIQSRLDFQLIKFLAVKNPDKLFVFVGKVWPEVDSVCREIKNFKNIRFIGPRLHQDLPEIISQFTVAIVPHKINDLTKSMDPMKIYEYLTCGRSVVSTAVIDPANFAGLVDIARSHEEFNQKINQNLNKKQDIIFKQQALAFIQKNTWEKRAGEMMEIINRSKNK